MSSRYQKQFAIPEGFPALLKSFTREVLRQQPTNIYEFGARFFAELIEQRKGTSQGALDKSMLEAACETAALAPQEDLTGLLTRLFKAADADNSGYLCRNELCNVLKSAELPFTPQQVTMLLAEVDENEDGKIQYQEFVPLMMDIMAVITERQQAQAVQQDVVQQVHGMTKEQLEGLLLNIFQAADTDGSGALDYKEFKKCLQAADLGLTRKDINALLSCVDVNHDRLVSFQEFVPLCYEVLVQLSTQE